jgi:hypothetical protein
MEILNKLPADTLNIIAEKIMEEVADIVRDHELVCISHQKPGTWSTKDREPVYEVNMRLHTYDQIVNYTKVYRTIKMIIKEPFCDMEQMMYELEKTRPYIDGYGTDITKYLNIYCHYKVYELIYSFRGNAKLYYRHALGILMLIPDPWDRCRLRILRH